jgi:hypothetical protein
MGELNDADAMAIEWEGDFATNKLWKKCWKLIEIVVPI